jgi:hypothetical protein
MSGPSVTGPGTTGPSVAGITVRARDVLGSEWTKFCSVRSTFWTLLVAVLTPVGISALIAVALASSPGQGADQGDALMPGLFSMEYAVLAGHHHCPGPVSRARCWPTACCCSSWP